jgi:hypothetical protein
MSTPVPIQLTTAQRDTLIDALGMTPKGQHWEVKRHDGVRVALSPSNMDQAWLAFEENHVIMVIGDEAHMVEAAELEVQSEVQKLLS